MREQRNICEASDIMCLYHKEVDDPRNQFVLGLQTVVTPKPLLSIVPFRVSSQTCITEGFSAVSMLTFSQLSIIMTTPMQWKCVFSFLNSTHQKQLVIW